MKKSMLQRVNEGEQFTTKAVVWEQAVQELHRELEAFDKVRIDFRNDEHVQRLLQFDAARYRLAIMGYSVDVHPPENLSWSKFEALLENVESVAHVAKDDFLDMQKAYLEVHGLE